MIMNTITPGITGCSEQAAGSTLDIMAAYDNWENKQNHAFNSVTKNKNSGGL